MIRAAGMSVRSWFNAIWYERATPPWGLVPLSLLYGAAVHVRRFLYAQGLLRSTKVQLPVIVVGNLSVGGTGKTPLVCWLVAQLAARGFKPGVVARGYGGSVKAVRRVEGSDGPALVGDESVVIKRRTRVPVVVGRNRPEAARLLENEGCNVVVSDDGLQHYALARDCEVVVIDGERGLGNGRLMPAGPLRESAARLKAVDVVVLNGGKAHSESILGMRLEATGAIALRGGACKPLQAFSGTTVHAVAGIGNPQRFFGMLRAHGIDVSGHALDDHARIRARDITFDDDKPVLMTEKDAVKCEPFAGGQHWYVPITAAFDSRESDRLLAIVMGKIADRARELAKGPING